ncbi:MAG: hypothetical protein ACYDEX_03265 [Mobilitalea sp.]
MKIGNEIKKRAIMLLVGVFMLGTVITGCGKSSGTNTDTNEATVSETESQEAAVNETESQEVKAEVNEFSAEFNITGDYMVEDADTGALTVSSFPSTPLGENDVATGYAGSFGAFVDQINVYTSLVIDGDTYTYTVKTQCGTEENSIGYYAPEYVWTGDVLSKDDKSITIAAPTGSTVTIYADGQFATNAEQVGYFGEVGYSATESTTDCPYAAVPSGDALLSMVAAGTFTLDNETLISFTSDTEEFSAEFNITGDYMVEDADTGALSVSSYPNTPLGENAVAVGYAESFGAFVDQINVYTTLVIDGDTYTYTVKTQCGTEENSIGYYAPEYVWTGVVLSKDDKSITIAAPTGATVTIYADGQFATNAEQVGYFGEVGYSATESTTDCPYAAVPSGDALLSMVAAGTFTLDNGTLVSFTVAE